MIVNEIAKFENRDHAAVELLLVAELREASARHGHWSARRRPPCASSSGGHRYRTCTDRGKGVMFQPMIRRDCKPGSARKSTEKRAMTDVAQTLARLSALLGPPDGEPVPLDGGITNRNYKVDFGGKPYVIRVPGKDTDAARHRPRGGVGGVVRGGAGRRRAAGSGDARGPAGPRHRLRRGPARDRGGAARARRCSRRSPSRCAGCTTAARSCRRPSRRSGSWRSTRIRRAPRRRRSAGRLRRRARSAPSAIEKALNGPEHEPVPCHNDLLAAQPAPATATTSGSSTGSTRAWATATSTSATSP